MRVIAHFAVSISLLGTAFATPILAQDFSRHENNQYSIRPLTISAHFVKQTPAPKGPQMKYFAYVGNAELSLADCRMTADRLTSYYSDGQLSKVVARGHVILVRRGTAKRTEFKATSETATYTCETDDITLNGQIQLLRYEGTGKTFAPHVKSVSYNVSDGTIGLSLPRFELYDAGKVY